MLCFPPLGAPAAACAFLTEVHHRVVIQVFRSCFVFQHLGVLDFDRFASLLLAHYVSRYFVCLGDVRCEAWISIFRFLGSKSLVLKHMARPYVRSWAAGSSSCWLLVWGGGGPTGRNPFF